MQFWASPRRLVTFLPRIVLSGRCVSRSTRAPPRRPQQMPDLSTNSARQSGYSLQRDVVDARGYADLRWLGLLVRPPEIGAEATSQPRRWTALFIAHAPIGFVQSAIRPSLPTPRHQSAPQVGTARTAESQRGSAPRAVMMPRVRPSPHGRLAADRRTHARCTTARPAPMPACRCRQLAVSHRLPAAPARHGRVAALCDAVASMPPSSPAVLPLPASRLRYRDSWPWRARSSQRRSAPASARFRWDSPDVRRPQ